MVTYELLYLTQLFEQEGDRAAMRTRVEQIITEAGGNIVVARVFARQRLSYPIARRDAGEYTLVEFAAPAGAPAVIARELHLQDGILRSLVTVKNAKARAIGAEVEAMERLQAQREHARAEAAQVATRAAAADASAPETIANLDEKLEELLGKEMI